MYPNISGDTLTASLFFYDLVVYRNKPNDDIAEAVIKSKEPEVELDLTVGATGATGAVTGGTGILFKDKIGQTPEDSKFTKDTFENIIEYIRSNGKETNAEENSPV